MKLAVAGVLLLLAPLAFAAGADPTRTIYVAALDAKGNPIPDLRADDLSVREDGNSCPITSFARATDPIDLSIIDDDYGHAFFTPAVAQLILALGDRARYSISALLPARLQLTNFTSDSRTLSAALQQLGERGQFDHTGERGLRDAILEAAAESMHRQSSRRVLLVLTMSPEGFTTLPFGFPPLPLTEDLLKADVTLDVVYFYMPKFGPLTVDGPEETGGQVERVSSQASANQAIVKIGSVLLNQYALTCARPAGARSEGRIRVSTTRKGVTMVAPRRVPTHVVHR